MNISRIVSPNADQQLATIVMSILTIPRTYMNTIQSMLIFPGVGGPGRIFDAIEYMHTRSGTWRHLVVPGINPQEAWENNFEIFTEQMLRAHPYHISEHLDLSVQGDTEHTGSQAEWIAQVFDEKSIGSSIIMAAPFHLPRAFLTTLTALKRHGRFETVLMPLPGAVPPMQLLTEFGGSSWELFAGELVRIREYQKLGHILGDDEIVEYLTWLWQDKSNLCPV